MRDDHPPGKPADLDRRRAAGQQKAPLRRGRLGPDEERQSTKTHPPERNITRHVAKNLDTGVAGSGQVYWLIARHASDRKEMAGLIPVNFGQVSGGPPRLPRRRLRVPGQSRVGYLA